MAIVRTRVSVRKTNQRQRCRPTVDSGAPPIHTTAFKTSIRPSLLFYFPKTEVVKDGRLSHQTLLPQQQTIQICGVVKRDHFSTSALLHLRHPIPKPTFLTYSCFLYPIYCPFSIICFITTENLIWAFVFCLCRSQTNQLLRWQSIRDLSK